MFVYEKKLQFPVKIATPNPKLAAFIISQYGGPDGEVGASMRYLSQRYSMPYAEAKGLLTDIGTEELGHMEMVAAIVHQLTRNLTEDQIRNSAFAPYFVDHTTGVYPTAASGFPWSAGSIQSTGDVIADLTEDMAADGAMGEGQHMEGIVNGGWGGSDIGMKNGMIVFHIKMVLAEIVLPALSLTRSTLNAHPLDYGR